MAFGAEATILSLSLSLHLIQFATRLTGSDEGFRPISTGVYGETDSSD